MAITNEYRKFYMDKQLTRREIKTLNLIDRIRYLIKAQPQGPTGKWKPAEIHQRLLFEGLISTYITKENIEEEMRAYYG